GELLAFGIGFGLGGFDVGRELFRLLEQGLFFVTFGRADLFGQHVLLGTQTFEALQRSTAVGVSRDDLIDQRLVLVTSSLVGAVQFRVFGKMLYVNHMIQLTRAGRNLHLVT